MPRYQPCSLISNPLALPMRMLAYVRHLNSLKTLSTLFEITGGEAETHQYNESGFLSGLRWNQTPVLVHEYGLNEDKPFKSTKHRPTDGYLDFLKAIPYQVVKDDEEN